MFYSKETARCNDTFCYQGEQFYKIVESIPGDPHMTVRKLDKKPFHTEDIGLRLNWALVGCYERGEVQNECFSVRKADMQGKAVVLDNRYLLKFPKEWLV